MLSCWESKLSVTSLTKFKNCVEDYIKLAEQHVADINNNDDIPQELVGSFRVWVGKQDEIVHIWKYNGGYAALDKAVAATKNEWNEYRNWGINF